MAKPARQEAPFDRKVSLPQLDLIVARLDCLPALTPAPGLALGLAPDAKPRGLPTGEDPSARLVELIRLDPALCARALSLANQSSQSEILTVRQAVRALGLPAARAAVLACPALPPDRQGSAEGLELQGFWRHCLAVALAAEMLASRCDPPFDPEQAFTWGLLHDLGKWAMLQVLPKSYGRALQAARRQGGSLADHERAEIGVDHAVFGRRLAERWRLPDAIREAIWLHHQPPQALAPGEPAGRRAGLVGLADAVAREQGLGFAGNPAVAPRPVELAGPIGLGPAAIEDVAGRLAHELQLREARLGPDAAAARRPGQGIAADQAGQGLKELDLLNRQLQQESRSWAWQARAMGCLARFARSLRAEATVADALAGIAELLAESFAADGPVDSLVLAYSIGPQDEGVLAVCRDPAGRSQLRAFRLGPAADGAAADAPRTGAEALADLLGDPSELSGWVDVSACRHYPLRCAGRWVGGVLWAGPPDAEQAGTVEQLIEIAALSLGLVQQRARAARLGEQLSAAWGRLSATQDSLAEAKALAAVGEMAAGAAHEINNPLAVISGRAQLMRDRAGDSGEGKVWQLVVDQAQRISDIITDLMAFARPPAPCPQEVESAGLLREAAELFGRSDHPQASSAKVDIDKAEALPALWVDRRQIASVLVDLLANAAAAAGPKGRICLGAQAGPARGSVVLTVADDGPGMDAQTLAAALAPFFSQQRAGRRRGLGLPRAKRAVEANGGTIWIRTEVGRGTTVYVQLPCRAQAG